MSRGGARVGAGRKPAPEGAVSKRADGSMYEKRAGEWVRLPGVRERDGSPVEINSNQSVRPERRESYLEYRREYLRAWRRRRKAA